jgi:hypothetical protein
MGEDLLDHHRVFDAMILTAPRMLGRSRREK